MPSRIQAQPLGLLQLLSMVGTGQQPTEFGDTVVPVVDLTELYGSEKFSIVVVQETIIPAANYALLLPVPSGEFWIVNSAQASVSCAAGNWFDLSLRYRLASGTQQTTFADFKSQQVGRALAGTIMYGCTLPRPICLRGGAELVLRCDDTNETANNRQFTLSASVYRLPLTA